MTTTLKIWFESLKTTLTSASTLVLLVLYALLLVSFYFFISTREATVWQVFVTYALLFLVPALFFIFQAAVLDFARQHKFAVKQVVLSALKLFLVTIPVVLFGLFVWWLMNKLQARFPAPPAPGRRPRSGPGSPALRCRGSARGSGAISGRGIRRVPSR